MILVGVGGISPRGTKEKKMNKFFGLLGLLFVALLFTAPRTSLAATPGAYIAQGINSFKYTGFKPSGTERQILDSPGITGSYSVNDSSTEPEISAGYCFNEYFCGDLSYTKINMSTSTKVTNINAGTINVNGTVYNLGNYNTRISFVRELSATAKRLSVSGEYPLAYGIGVLGRVGIYFWEAHIQNKLAFDSSGIYLGYDEYDKGEAPMASVGLSYRFTKKITGSIEFLRINDMTATSARINFTM